MAFEITLLRRVRSRLGAALAITGLLSACREQPLDAGPSEPSTSALLPSSPALEPGPLSSASGEPSAPSLAAALEPGPLSSASGEPSAPAVASEPAPQALPPPPDNVPPPDVAGPPADALRTGSGLASRVLTPGSGSEHPGPRDRVQVRYEGWTKQGERFSVIWSNPLEFTLARAIAGWVEGLQLMLPGEKRRLWVPSALAYGDRPAPGLPAGPLTFDVELVAFSAGATAPQDLAGPPTSAQRSKSGLRFEVLSPGSGSVRPRPNSTVMLRYTGWLRDGRVFDSSAPDGEPFRLQDVILGWREGLQQMVTGERRRLWIPARLAYNALSLEAVVRRRAQAQPGVRRGESSWIPDDLACRFWIPGNRDACREESPSKKPLGAVVFDIELLEILPPAAPSARAQRSVAAEPSPSEEPIIE